MRSLIKYTLGLFLCFGCASTSEVIYDYNLDVDFNTFDTYVLCIDDLFVENYNYPNLDNQKVRQLLGDAVSNAMELRGHKTNVFKPQLQAGFRIVITEERVEFNNCEHSKELEYWEECKIHNEIYQKETLVVYVAEFETNKVIWQASVGCSLNKADRNLKPYIEELTTLLFETYPKAIETL
ncbi:MAG: DUF4136 domain-containing protein [Winogradskyella sp.]|nr:DUF4136 domain-containing protein [Winogradskyella sp.]